MRLLILIPVRWMLGTDQKGQDLIEYALFGGFIAVIAATAIPVAIGSVGQALSRIISTLTSIASSLSPS